jgi:hypothetical protein
MTCSLRLSALCLSAIVLAMPAFAIQQGVSTQVRKYGTHREFEDRLFTGDDYGYGAAYELRDDKGAWQLGAFYAPDVGRDDEIDYVITPYLSVILKDRLFMAGLGVDQGYVAEYGDQDAEWTDLYWHALMGLEFPLGKRLAVSGMAIYDYEHWDELDGFDFDDVEFAAALTLLF